MNKRAGIFLMAALAIVVALAGLVFIRGLIDFPVYYAAGNSLISGRSDLYSADFAQGPVMDYRYLPFFLVALVPLWLLPYTAAAYIWYLLAILQIVACFLALRWSGFKYQPGKKCWIILSLAVAQYFIMILHYGNAHLLAVCFFFLSIYLLIREKQIAAAALMSLAITIKLTPILILPYFALKKKWKYVLLTIGFIGLINIAPAIYFGFEKNNLLMKTWFEHVIVNQEFHETNGPINLSLKGQLRRCFSQVDYSQRVDGDVQYPPVNVAALSAKQVDLLWLILSAFFSALVMSILWWRTYKRRERPDSFTQSDSRKVDPLELSLMICLMLLVGPLTSKIYFIALLWPVGCLAAFAFSNSSRQARLTRIVLIFIAATNFVLPLLPGRSIQRLLLVLGVDFYLNLLLITLLVYVLGSRRLALPGSSVAPQTQAP